MRSSLTTRGNTNNCASPKARSRGASFWLPGGPPKKPLPSKTRHSSPRCPWHRLWLLITQKPQLLLELQPASRAFYCQRVPHEPQRWHKSCSPELRSWPRALLLCKVGIDPNPKVRNRDCKQAANSATRSEDPLACEPASE